MKNHIKILCVFLSLIIAMSVFAIVPVSVSAADTKTDSLEDSGVSNGDEVIYFDNSGTNWAGPIKFYIYDVETGAELKAWGSKKLDGTDEGGGIWSKDISDYGLEPGKQYAIIFNDGASNAQTYDLMMDTSCFGDTAYCDGTTKPNLYDKICQVARWTNPTRQGVSGECTWGTDGSVLTIYGSGKMGNYGNIKAPWVYMGGITEVVIEDGVTTIGKYAFDGCTDLNSVTYGSSVYSIAQGAFSGCESLESVTLPDSVQIIADDAFSHCTALSSVTIPDSVTDIGEDAFYECPNLKRVTIPASVTNINEKAFGYYRNDEFGITMKVPGFTIYGDVGSEGQRYAKAFGFSFERVIAMTGDADGDCEVTLLDVTEVQHTLALVETGSDDDITKYTDIDENGLLEIVDATWIQRYVADMDIPYVVGKVTYNG